MSAATRIMAGLAAAALLGGATAHAESVHPLISSTSQPASVADQSLFGLVPIHKSLQWDDKGRWSLKLDMNEPLGRAMQLRDVQAGAYYHVTPSLKVGGAVSLGDEQVVPDRNSLPQAQPPRVRLETRFKF